jgi:hypothetical protein
LFLITLAGKKQQGQWRMGKAALNSFLPETTISPNIIVAQDFLSSEYLLYACGKKYCAPRS